jgi:hypothetical protein
MSMVSISSGLPACQATAARVFILYRPVIFIGNRVDVRAGKFRMIAALAVGERQGDWAPHIE